MRRGSRQLQPRPRSIASDTNVFSAETSCLTLHSLCCVQTRTKMFLDAAAAQHEYFIIQKSDMSQATQMDKVPVLEQATTLHCLLQPHQLCTPIRVHVQKQRIVPIKKNWTGSWAHNSLFGADNLRTTQVFAFTWDALDSNGRNTEQSSVFLRLRSDLAV